MTQEELADRIGTDQPTVSKWERNLIRPSLENIRLIEAATKRPRGFVFIAAGLVDLAQDVRHAIELDTALTDDGRRSVLAVYDAMIR